MPSCPPLLRRILPLLTRLLLALLFLAGAVYVVNWYRTHPRFLFAAPLAECTAARIPLDNALYARPCTEVAAFAEAHGVSPQLAARTLALRGHELLALEPLEFHGSKTHFRLKEAGVGYVYFYAIHPRYIPSLMP